MKRKRLIVLLIALELLIIFVGHWMFVNHARNNNIIISQSQKIIKTCKTKLIWRECYGSELAKLTGQENFFKVLGVLNNIQKNDSKTNECHIIAHAIAYAELSKNPQNWEAMLTKISPYICNYGFFHGFIEAHGKYDSHFILDKQSISQICTTISKKIITNQVDEMCIHIMGHLLLAQENSMNQSLDVCNQLENVRRFQCSTGVFMESVTRDNIVSHGLGSYISWNKENLVNQEKLCSTYSGEESKACWQEISHLYTFVYPDKPNEVFKLCSHAPDNVSRDVCYFHAVALMIVKENADNAYYASLCVPYASDKKVYMNCIHDAIKYLLESSFNFVNKAEQFCSASDQKDVCKDDIKRLQKEMGSNYKL